MKNPENFENLVKQEINQLSKLGNPDELRSAFNALFKENRKSSQIEKSIKDAIDETNTATDREYLHALAKILVLLNKNQNPSVEENKLKNKINNILWMIKLKKRFSYHYFGYLFKFIFDSKFRKRILDLYRNINQHYPRSDTKNIKFQKRQSDFKRAYRNFLSAIIADLLFWSGIGLIIVGIFFPPVMFIGISFLGAGILMYTYLNIGIKTNIKGDASSETDKDPSKDCSSDTDEVSSNYGSSDTDEVSSNYGSSDTDEVSSNYGSNDEDTKSNSRNSSTSSSKILIKIGSLDISVLDDSLEFDQEKKNMDNKNESSQTNTNDQRKEGDDTNSNVTDEEGNQEKRRTCR